MHVRSACAALCVAMFPFAAHADALRWQHRPGFATAGSEGIVTLDLDGDGRDESVFSAATAVQHSSFGVLGRNAGGNAVLEQVLNLDGLLAAPIVSGTGGSGGSLFALVQTYNTLDFALIEYGDRPLRELRRMPHVQFSVPRVVADVDGDGDLDILVTTSPYVYSTGRVSVRDYASGDVLWTDTQDCISVVAVQLDADPALEIVIGGDTGRVIDGAMGAQEWSYPLGFSGELYAGQSAPSTTSMATGSTN